MDRIIGQYSSGRKGPLLIIIGAIHGNETAGPAALAQFFKLIEEEKNVNPSFYINGKVIGVYGNMEAYKRQVRYVDFDMNRAWLPKNLHDILHLKENAKVEHNEIISLITLLQEIVTQENADKVIIMDLHTTSSQGGTFVIPADHKESAELAKTVEAPVILGMLKDVKGTAMEFLPSYFGRNTNCTGLAFESGHHEDPLSVDRALAAIVNLMKSTDMIEPSFVEEKHTNILKEFSEGIPKMFDLNYKYLVKHDGNFLMKEGYKSFEKIEKGEHLATDGEEVICAECAGRILMPLYQKQGEDGFFIIEEIN